MFRFPDPVVTYTVLVAESIAGVDQMLPPMAFSGTSQRNCG
jgi:hypothetical protein